MDFLPFPEPYATETAERTRAAYNESRARRRTPSVGDSFLSRDAAAYRLPDGTVRGVYDRYRPCYPVGAVPGLADITDTLKYYPNGTHGYVSTIASFRPLA
jgi:hypothetical protein